MALARNNKTSFEFPLDDCYIEEDGDEYLMVDLLHPDLRVEIIVAQG